MTNLKLIPTFVIQSVLTVFMQTTCKQDGVWVNILKKNCFYYSGQAKIFDFNLGVRTKLSLIEFNT